MTGQGAGLTAAIATVSIAGFGLSMTHPLIALLLERAGASGLEIGLNAAAPAAAMLAGGLVMPRALRAVGAAPLLLGACVTLAATLLLFKPLSGFGWWTALRGLHGLAATAVFFASELWIVAVAPPERRGWLIGVYALCLSLGFLAGPLTLSLVGVEGWAPFLAAAGASLAAGAPVLWAWRAAPASLSAGPAKPPPVLLRMRTDPSLMLAVALFGMIEFGGFALMPVWALGSGMDQDAALRVSAMLALGNVALQLPLGWAADRFDRRALLVGAAAISAAAAALMGLSVGRVWAVMMWAALLGGVAVALYTVSLAELGARYRGDALAGATGAVMMAYGFGALIAPPLMGRAMDAAGPDGLLWTLGGAAGGYALFAAWRARARGAP